MSEVSPELITLDAPTLVEASAGTGKTHTITTYFVRAILERGLMPDRILVVTYTKAATAELRVRARRRILNSLAMIDESPPEPDALYEVVTKAVEKLGGADVEKRLRSALGQMDQAAILTIHGFCQRLLQQCPLSFGVELELEVTENVASLHADLAVDFWATELYDKPEWLLRALRERKVSIDYLRRLARVATMPGVEVIGPEPREVDADAMNRVSALHRQVAKLWFEHRSTILDLLGDEGLYGSIYRTTTIRESWTPDLDRLFTPETFQPLPDFFKWLCSNQMAQKTKKGHQPPRHVFFDACAELVEAHDAIAPMIDSEVFSLQSHFCDFVRDRLRQRCDEAALFSFDDLLTTVYAGVTANAAVATTVRQAYPLALVDEFQDTDSIQYGIFRTIYGDGAAVYVGDPKQAIYAFRGADVFSYLEAAVDVGQRRYTLSTNRRSDPGMVHAVNRLFSQRVPPFLIEGIPFEAAHPHGVHDRTTLAPPLEIVFLDGDTLRGPSADRVAPIAANEVALLLQSDARIDDRQLEPGDVAVLCRSNNQAIAVTRALRSLNVPTSFDGDASVLNTAVATDLSAVLEAALMPGDSAAVRRALLTSLVGVSPFELASMGDDAWSDWVTRFRGWSEAWHQYGVLRFLEEMLDHTGAETIIGSRPSARRDLTDLLHLQELLLRGESERQRDPVALLQWFRRLSDGTPDEGMVALEDLQQRPDAQKGTVRVTTIHKSKGLEYGVVFCPFTWGDAKLWDFDRRAVKFHDRDGHLKIDLGSAQQKEHLKAARLEAASEAIRLLYVAVTRAKHRCTLFWGPGPRWKDSALGYLMHGPEALGRLSEDDMRADVDVFVANAGQAALCRSPHMEQATPVHRDDSNQVLLPRPQTRRFDHTPRIASFSSLTGQDDKAAGPSVPQTTSLLFAELPGGTRTGLLLHSILERAELGALDTGDARSLIAGQLALYGFDSALAASVQRDLAAVVSTPLLDDQQLPALSDLDRERQLRELEFTLAVESPRLEALCELLRKHGGPASAPGYHERLAQMSGRTLRGFLRGFIDLVFEWEGRWYVADYKSNRLASYEPSTVVEAVQREHYVLQGVLYSAAANRYLRQRVPHYEAAEHWGGALLLFVRGMAGPERAGASVFFDRQTPELLDAIDVWLGGHDGSH